MHLALLQALGFAALVQFAQHKKYPIRRHLLIAAGLNPSSVAVPYPILSLSRSYQDKVATSA
jgi:hypothetical protein